MQEPFASRKKITILSKRLYLFVSSASNRYYIPKHALWRYLCHRRVRSLIYKRSDFVEVTRVVSYEQLYNLENGKWSKRQMQSRTLEAFRRHSVEQHRIVPANF